MTILKLIITIMVSSFLLSGCITKRLSVNIKNKYTAKEEFLGCRNIESDKLVATIGDGHINIFKGVYLGENIKNKKSYHNLQFEGMLEGSNRILDIYVGKDTNSFPDFHEVKTMQKGKDAFLFLAEYGFMHTKGAEYFQKTDKFYSPELLYEFAGIKEQQVPDTCVLIALYYFQDPVNSFNSETVTNIYFKEPNNTYSMQQISSESTKDKVDKHFYLKYRTRNKMKKNLKKMMYVITVPLDIVTSPIQLIGIIIIKRIFKNGSW